MKNTKYKILTPTGFQTFDGIKKVEKSEYLKITLENDVSIRCSLDHPFIVNNEIILAKNLKNSQVLDTATGGKQIKTIQYFKDFIGLYDILNVFGGNIFYANKILVHNCDADFSSSGNTFIPPDLIAYYKLKTSDPLEKTYFSDLWIWEYEDYSKNYVISADVARGDGEDYSTAQVIDAVSLNQVAEFKSKISTRDFGMFLVSLATRYNKGLLVIDNSGVGWDTVQTVLDSGYQNVFFSYKDNNVVDLNSYLYKGLDLLDNSQKTPGLTMSVKSRPLILSKMEYYMREKMVQINSTRLITELESFNWINGKAQASTGYNDDLVMGYAGAMFVRDHALRIQSKSSEYDKNIVDSIANSISNGRDAVIPTHDSWMFNVGNEREDLSMWLK